MQTITISGPSGFNVPMRSFKSSHLADSAEQNVVAAGILAKFSAIMRRTCNLDWSNYNNWIAAKFQLRLPQWRHYRGAIASPLRNAIFTGVNKNQVVRGKLTGWLATISPTISPLCKWWASHCITTVINSPKLHSINAIDRWLNAIFYLNAFVWKSKTRSERLWRVWMQTKTSVDAARNWPCLNVNVEK